MTTYGYIPTSRGQEPGHPGSDPQVQSCQLVEAGVEPPQIYADVPVSGAKSYNSRDQWHRLDRQLVQGDGLVVGCCHQPPGTPLPRHDVGDLSPATPQRKAAVPGRQRGPVDDIPGRRPDSRDAFMGNVPVIIAAYVASQERQDISRRAGASLDSAR